jgi:hypothetical protein
VPPRATLAAANRRRNSLAFSRLFEHLLGMATRPLRRKIGNMVRLIDSTGLHLAGIGSEWARLSAKLCGAKAHIIDDPDFACPIYPDLSWGDRGQRQRYRRGQADADRSWRHLGLRSRLLRLPLVGRA